VYARTNGDASNVVIQSEIDDTALNTRGYQKVRDLSSDITNSANLTFYKCKAYKVGNIVNLTISGYNATGSEITNGTTLITLGTSLKPIDDLVIYVRGAGQDGRAILDKNGTVSISFTLPNGQGSSGFTIVTTYAVA
jgi:hypothetical protein